MKSNADELTLLNKLLSLPRISILGDIDDAMLREQIEQIDKVKHEPEILLLIGSRGGYSAITLSLFEHLRYLNNTTKVYALVAGACHSHGVTLLMSVDHKRRYASKNSQFFIHQLLNDEDITLQGTLSARKQILQYASEYVDLDMDTFAWLKRTLVGGSKIKPEALNQMMATPKPISAAQAIDLGLISEVIY